MPTDNKQPQTSSLPPVPTDDMSPLVVEETTPPMLNDNDLPVVNTPPAVTVEEKPIETASGSAAPSDDVVMAPIVTTQKKKFAGGKVIATILGLLVLIGGAGAGTYLVQQQQDIRERAGNVIECFPAGTKITTSTGETKNIEDFNSGDLVLSENIENGQKVTSKTTKLWNLYSFDMCSLSFEDGDTLKLTSPHPLFTKEGWKAINEVSGRKHNPELTITKLSTNDYIKKLDGSWSKVTDISCKYGLFKVYNLAVDTTNTYFAQEYLVHNKGGDGGVIIPDQGEIIYVDENTGDVIREEDGNDGDSNTDDGAGNANQDNLYGSTPGCGPSDTNSLMGYCTNISQAENCRGSGRASCDVGQYCHCQGGVSCNVGVCVNAIQFTNACNSDGREVAVNAGAGNAYTCCERNYVAGPGGIGCVQGTTSSNPPNNPPSEPTPPTTSITAQCQNVKAYSSTWTLLTNAQLATLAPNTTVNFCVSGVASGGSFDRAKFFVNGGTQQITTTKRPNSSDFCINYTIPANTYSFAVAAQLHHNTLGWRGPGQ